MSMGLLLVALAFPLMEVALLIKVGQWIGFWSTVLLLVTTAVVGGLLVQAQGINAGRRMMDSLNQGVAPLEPMIDSFLIMMAGFLLLVPGLITDVMGLALLVPPVRSAFARWAMRRTVAAPSGAQNRTSQEWRSPGREDADTPAGARQPERPPGARRGPVVIDGEWERIEGPGGTSKPAQGDDPPPRGDRR